MVTEEIPTGRIIQGDCVQVMTDWPSDTFDIIFADPPYNASGKSLEWKDKEQGGDWYKVNAEWDTYPNDQDYAKFTHQWIGEAARLLRDGGSMYVCSTYHGLGEILVAGKDSDLRVLNIIVWQKANPIPTVNYPPVEVGGLSVNSAATDA